MFRRTLWGRFCDCFCEGTNSRPKQTQQQSRCSIHGFSVQHALTLQLLACAGSRAPALQTAKAHTMTLRRNCPSASDQAPTGIITGTPSPSPFRRISEPSSRGDQEPLPILGEAYRLVSEGMLEPHPSCPVSGRADAHHLDGTIETFAYASHPIPSHGRSSP
jgi:hypothetical protein